VFRVYSLTGSCNIYISNLNKNPSKNDFDAIKIKYLSRNISKTEENK
jgi:hypothetical protein